MRHNHSWELIVLSWLIRGVFMNQRAPWFGIIAHKQEQYPKLVLIQIICRKSGNICTAKYICRGKCSKWNPNSSWRYAMSFNTSSSSELFLCNSKSSSFAATWKSWKSTSILLIWGELKKLLVLLHVLPVVKIDSLQNLLKEERSVASALGCSLWSTFKKICQGACWRP